MASYQQESPEGVRKGRCDEADSSSNKQTVTGGSVYQAAAAARDPKVLIRAAAAFFALVSFSCIAAAKNKIVNLNLNTTSDDFLIFVGVVSIFLDIAFIVTYTRGDTLPPAWLARLPITELVISAIWTILWFAGSIAVAVATSGYTQGGQIPIPFSTFNGGVAFGFFATFAWAASTFFAFRRYRTGSGASGPMQYSDI